MKYLKLFIVIAVLVLSGCSIQIAGLNNCYQNPANQTKSAIATLNVASDDITIVSIDGKSISGEHIALYPGEHKVTLYIGSNNYVSDVNHMIIIAAKFNANCDYTLKSKLCKAWVEDANGAVVSSVISDMHTKKSVSI